MVVAIPDCSSNAIPELILHASRIHTRLWKQSISTHFKTVTCYIMYVRHGTMTPPSTPSRRNLSIPEHDTDTHDGRREGGLVDADRVLIPSSKIFHADGSINNPFVLGRDCFDSI